MKALGNAIFSKTDSSENPPWLPQHPCDRSQSRPGISTRTPGQAPNTADRRDYPDYRAWNGKSLRKTGKESAEPLTETASI
jgi:hypothetical protein